MEGEAAQQAESRGVDRWVMGPLGSVCKLVLSFAGAETRIWFTALPGEVSKLEKEKSCKVGQPYDDTWDW